MPDPSAHDLVRAFAGAGGLSAAGEQDQIIIVMDGVGSLFEVADGGTRKTYLVREDGESRGDLTVESVNGEDLVVGSDAVPGVDWCSSPPDRSGGPGRPRSPPPGRSAPSRARVPRDRAAGRPASGSAARTRGDPGRTAPCRPSRPPVP